MPSAATPQACASLLAQHTLHARSLSQGVKTDATPEEIKKQYYKLARQNHPDKNPGDTSAHAKFQKLGEAYRGGGGAYGWFRGFTEGILKGAGEAILYMSEGRMCKLPTRSSQAPPSELFLWSPIHNSPSLTHYPPTHPPEPPQVLGNPDLRKRYDAKGKAGVSQDGFMEGNEFFSMLCGSEQFEDLLGELISASARAG